MYVQVCMYIYIYTHIYIHDMKMYACMHIYIYIYIYTEREIHTTHDGAQLPEIFDRPGGRLVHDLDDPVV